jgi:hypothetical protein
MHGLGRGSRKRGAATAPAPYFTELVGGAVCLGGPPRGGQLVASGRIPIQAILAAVGEDQAAREGA